MTFPSSLPAADPWDDTKNVGGPSSPAAVRDDEAVQKKNKAARQIQTVEMALSEAAAPQKLFFQHLAVIPRSEATRDLPRPQHLAVIPRNPPAGG